MIEECGEPMAVDKGQHPFRLEAETAMSSLRFFQKTYKENLFSGVSLYVTRCFQGINPCPRHAFQEWRF
jgi:hypothetical protein